MCFKKKSSMKIYSIGRELKWVLLIFKFYFLLCNDNNKIQSYTQVCEKKENGREWWDGMERFVLYIAHTFEVHVCVVSLSFTKLRLNLTKTYKSVITWLTNGLCFVTESRDNILSHLSQPNRFYPAGGVLFGFQKIEIIPSK